MFRRKRKKAGFEAIGARDFTVRLNGADNLMTGRLPTCIEISTPTGEGSPAVRRDSPACTLIDLERDAS